MRRVKQSYAGRRRRRHPAPPGPTRRTQDPTGDARKIVGSAASQAAYEAEIARPRLCQRSLVFVDVQRGQTDPGRDAMIAAVALRARLREHDSPSTNARAMHLNHVAGV